MKMTLHCEPIYGFYHGQDPRTFSPDGDCCSKKELDAHRAACELADKGEWVRDGSGCHQTAPGIVVCSSSFGIGVYEVVMSDDGEFIRDATWEDYQREGGWEEDVEVAATEPKA
jgi:hypothetical protein